MSLAHDIRAILHAPYRLIPVFRRTVFMLGEEKVKTLLQASYEQHEQTQQTENPKSWLACFLQQLKQLPERKCILSKPSRRKKKELAPLKLTSRWRRTGGGF